MTEERTDIWERVKAIPGPWEAYSGVISHGTIRDSLGNRASIQIALLYHEKGKEWCNCCTGCLMDEWDEDELQFMRDLAWLGPPSMDEYRENPRAARKKYEGVPKNRTPHQEILLNGWVDPTEEVRS